MIYHQFVTDYQHFSTHISNMVHTLELFFINKYVPKWVTISLNYLILVTDTTLFTYVICDNL